MCLQLKSRYQQVELSSDTYTRFPTIIFLGDLMPLSVGPVPRSTEIEPKVVLSGVGHGERAFALLDPS